MTDPIFEKEHEPCEPIGYGQLWGAAVCVVLSAMSCVLWIVVLLSPHVLR